MTTAKRPKRKDRTGESARYRAKYPIKAAYMNLRTNCRRRHGDAWFYLTYEEFAEFAIETNYIAGKGRTKLSYHIDRIDPTMGYFIGNIQRTTCSYNSRKYTKKLHYEWDNHEQRMVAWVT